MTSNYPPQTPPHRPFTPGTLAPAANAASARCRSELVAEGEVVVIVIVVVVAVVAIVTTVTRR